MKEPERSLGRDLRTGPWPRGERLRSGRSWRSDTAALSPHPPWTGKKYIVVYSIKSTLQMCEISVSFLGLHNTLKFLVFRNYKS